MKLGRDDRESTLLKDCGHTLTTWKVEGEGTNKTTIYNISLI